MITLRITAGEAHDTLTVDDPGERIRIEAPAGFSVWWEVSPGLGVRWTPRERHRITMVDGLGEIEIRLAA